MASRRLCGAEPPVLLFHWDFLVVPRAHPSAVPPVSVLGSDFVSWVCWAVHHAVPHLRQTKVLPVGRKRGVLGFSLPHGTASAASPG